LKGRSLKINVYFSSACNQAESPQNCAGKIAVCLEDFSNIGNLNEYLTLLPFKTPLPSVISLESGHSVTENFQKKY
jgi:hypothetical protein